MLLSFGANPAQQNGSLVSSLHLAQTMRESVILSLFQNKQSGVLVAGFRKVAAPPPPAHHRRISNARGSTVLSELPAGLTKDIFENSDE